MPPDDVEPEVKVEIVNQIPMVEWSGRDMIGDEAFGDYPIYGAGGGGHIRKPRNR